MKGNLTPIVIVLLLSLAIWVFLYLAAPPPLGVAETVVVVLVVGAIVFGVRSLIGLWLKKKRGGDDNGA